MDYSLYHVLALTLITRMRSYMVRTRRYAPEYLHEVEVRGIATLEHYGL